MAVVALSQKVEKTVQGYLERVASDDTDITFTTAIMEQPHVCESEEISFHRVLWLCIWVSHPREPERPAFKSISTIDLRLILDGDMDPVTMMLDEVWPQVNFGSIMTAVEFDLERTAQSEEG